MPPPNLPSDTIPKVPTAVTLSVRLAAVDRLKTRVKAKSDTDFAKAIGVDPAQVSRVFAGKAAPGPRFIAGAIRAFGYHALQDLLAVVPLTDRGES